MQNARSSACILLAVAASAGLAQAQLLNGGFEQPDLGFHTVESGQTYGDWTNAGPSNIEFVLAEDRAALPGLLFSAYEGQYWIDLVGTGTPSAIEQDIDDLEPGALYQLDWAQAGNVWGPDFAFTMEVVWNGVVVASNTQTHGGHNGANMNWQTHAIPVMAEDGTNRLSFRALTGGSARGPALDAVALTHIPCIADFNGDEALDFFDIQAFLQAFASENPFADINLDGSFDFFDIQAFLAGFSAGCP